MVKVTANNGNENYLIEIQSPTANTMVADEPVKKGASNKWLNNIKVHFQFQYIIYT